MITQVLCPTDSIIKEAAELLRQGQLVGFPTETVYGLGANALNENAVRSIFAAKGRPGDNPLILHISRTEQLFPLIDGKPSMVAKSLMNLYWPGPLTLIFPKSRRVPYAATGNLDTVAVRMPSNIIARRLIDETALPIAAPSGNRSGRPSPTTARHMLEDMNGIIPMILDGGPCSVGLESTVIDVTGVIPRILRPGKISPEMLEKSIGQIEIDSAIMRPLGENEKPRSPGMKYRHYAPAGTLTIFRGNADVVAEAICRRYDTASGIPLILALEQNLPLYGNRRVFSLGANAAQMAQRLFDALRHADDIHANVIFSEAVEEQGVGLAVMNRLGRAAAFHVVDL